MKAFKDTKYGDLTGQTYNIPIDVSRTKIKSLQGSPSVVKGEFDCTFNDLEDLNYAPDAVTGTFKCFNNKLTNLIGMPVDVKTVLCYGNKLESLMGMPKHIKGCLDCSYNNLTSLEHCPTTIEGYLDCRDNKIKDVIGDIIKYNIKANNYLTDKGNFAYNELFDKYNGIKSKGFRTLLGLKNEI